MLFTLKVNISRSIYRSPSSVSVKITEFASCSLSKHHTCDLCSIRVHCSAAINPTIHHDSRAQRSLTNQRMTLVPRCDCLKCRSKSDIWRGKIDQHRPQEALTAPIEISAENSGKIFLLVRILIDILFYFGYTFWCFEKKIRIYNSNCIYIIRLI